MAPNAEVDLRQTSNAKMSCDVDQECDLHAVRLLQRDGVKGAASPRRLAGEGLTDLTQAGVEQRENRASGELVDAPAAGRHVVEWPFVIPLHQLGFRPLQQG